MSEPSNSANAGKGVASSALLLTAVLAIVLAATFLKSPPPAQPSRPLATEPSPLPLGGAIRKMPPPPALPSTVVTKPTPSMDPSLVRLATRAQIDCARLSPARGRFTAQLLVACRAETVDRLLEAASQSTKIYVLPTAVRDEACFRVCFGTYATAQHASAAADLPTALRGKDKVIAVAIAKVLP